MTKKKKKKIELRRLARDIFLTFFYDDNNTGVESRFIARSLISEVKPSALDDDTEDFLLS